MTDVKPITPSPAAASPTHPDHPRWVKERTLAMEAEHIKLVGGTLRDAEAANRANLERLEGRKRHARPKTRRKVKSVAERQAERAEKGLTYKPVAPVIAPPKSPCNFCGRCVRCKREARVVAIMAKAREGDQVALKLTWDLVALKHAVEARKDYRAGDRRLYPFSNLRGRDKLVAFNAAIESVCDRSVKVLGAWR